VAFAGGGVFDLDGNPVGLVVPCGSRGMLVTLADVARGIEQQQSVPYRLWVELGFRVESGAEPRVREVRAGSRAARAGLRKGDRLQALEDLGSLLPPQGQFRLMLRRARHGVILRAVAEQP
jgi:hypothetical protein